MTQSATILNLQGGRLSRWALSCGADRESIEFAALKFTCDGEAIPHRYKAQGTVSIKILGIYHNHPTARVEPKTVFPNTLDNASDRCVGLGWESNGEGSNAAKSYG